MWQWQWMTLGREIDGRKVDEWWKRWFDGWLVEFGKNKKNSGQIEWEMDGWLGEWIEGRMGNGREDRVIMNGWMDKWRAEWIDGRRDEWISKWMGSDDATVDLSLIFAGNQRGEVVPFDRAARYAAISKTIKHGRLLFWGLQMSSLVRSRFYYFPPLFFLL